MYKQKSVQTKNYVAQGLAMRKHICWSVLSHGHEMVEYMRAISRTATLDFERVNFGLLGGFPWIRILECRESGRAGQYSTITSSKVKITASL